MNDAPIDPRVADFLQLPYHRVITGGPDEGYLGVVVELPGCVTAGATPEEALKNLDEAMLLWLESALAHGDPIPAPSTGNVRLTA